MKKFVLAACHIDQAKALQPIAALLVSLGHEVAVMLDINQSASVAWSQGALDFPDCEVTCLGERDVAQRGRSVLPREDGILVMVSPTPVGDTSVERVFTCPVVRADRKVYAYCEVPCGHLAPGWRHNFFGLEALFVAQKTPDLALLQPSPLIEVGVQVPTINHVQALATKEALGLRGNDPFIWYTGGPYAQAGRILRFLAHAVSALRALSGLNRLSIVFSRHGGDKEDPQSRSAYEDAAAFADGCGVTLIENSADHGASETTSFQRQQILKYPAIFEACSSHGVIVAGHGTDAMVKAPRVGIPSILCVGSELNPRIKEEKGCEKLPLPEQCPIQLTQLGNMHRMLEHLLLCRSTYQEHCRREYPRQERTPAEIIVERLVAAL